MTEYVPESAIDYGEVFSRGGQNLGDEDFALFKCPSCGRAYLIDYEVYTVYLDADDLSKRNDWDPPHAFCCVGCDHQFLPGEPIIGPKAESKFRVTWDQLCACPWRWITRPNDGG